MNLLQVLSDPRRWKNPATYYAFLSTLPAVIALFHVDFLGNNWNTIETFGKAVITLLIELGILMNPTTKGFTDKEGD